MSLLVSEGIPGRCRAVQPWRSEGRGPWRCGAVEWWLGESREGCLREEPPPLPGKAGRQSPPLKALHCGGYKGVGATGKRLDTPGWTSMYNGRGLEGEEGQPLPVSLGSEYREPGEG